MIAIIAIKDSKISFNLTFSHTLTPDIFLKLSFNFLSSFSPFIALARPDGRHFLQLLPVSQPASPSALSTISPTYMRAAVEQ